MHPIIRVAPEAEFLGADLNRQYDYVISIQDASRYPVVLRPDYLGTRLNLYFDDVVDGPTAATPLDIDKLYAFAHRWLAVAQREPANASLIVHCLAGVSRSAASAMLPLTLYYGDFREAARRLFFSDQFFSPNTHILHLIEEKLRPGQPSTIFEAVLEFRK